MFGTVGSAAVSLPASVALVYDRVFFLWMEKTTGVASSNGCCLILFGNSEKRTHWFLFQLDPVLEDRVVRIGGKEQFM